MVDLEIKNLLLLILFENIYKSVNYKEKNVHVKKIHIAFISYK